MHHLFNKRNFLFIILIILILAWVNFSFQKRFSNINLGSYARFYALVKQLAIIGILIIIAVFMWIPKNSLKSAKPNINIWLLTFFFTLFLGTTFALVMNPEGRFPWGNADSYLSIGARALKVRKFLESQNGKPFDAIVLGSSRSFTISAETLKNELNIDAFNMGVESATSVDIYGLVGFVLEHQEESPKVLIIEVAAPVINNDVWKTKGTLSLAQYLTVEKSGLIAEDVIKSTASFSGIANSLYAFNTTIIMKRPLAQVTYRDFQESGHLIRTPLTSALYKKRIRATLNHFKQIKCSSLNSDGTDYIERLIHLALSQKISIVFYRSPLNADFLKGAKIKDPGYLKCDQLVSTYFNQLSRKNSHVFFEDLAYYKPISELGRDGFTDVWHLTSRGADLVVDALKPKLETALEWAEEARK